MLDCIILESHLRKYTQSVTRQKETYCHFHLIHVCPLLYTIRQKGLNYARLEDIILKDN